MPPVGLHQPGRAELAGQRRVASQTELRVPFGALADPAIACRHELIVAVERFVIAVARRNETGTQRQLRPARSAVAGWRSSRRSHPTRSAPPSVSNRGLSAYDVPTCADGVDLPIGSRSLLERKAPRSPHRASDASFATAGRSMRLRHHHSVAALQQDVLLEPRPRSTSLYRKRRAVCLPPCISPQDLNVIQRRERSRAAGQTQCLHHVDRAG